MPRLLKISGTKLSRPPSDMVGVAYSQVIADV
jgi:hypothetical protein